ncbi:hypothetical protein L873DRAFT_981338 [Choiromyces venosus 120613-1]|uniref:Uncharacterized protein n=1 Tax=Choiromyces venosus 120613-1 TaxID=1336337 RepID=A0A3N4JL83_9PEZI|nr:hypothetical protein L873DRAFT_981338 [Choiromyces venosus 120613-1]
MRCKLQGAVTTHKLQGRLLGVGCGMKVAKGVGSGREFVAGIGEGERSWSGRCVSGVVEVPLAVPVPECSQSYGMAFLQEKLGAPPTLPFFKLPVPVSTRMCK